MTCINKGGDGSRGGCGKMWVDVSYLWGDVDCRECLKLRPTKRAPDAEEAVASQSVFNTETLSTSDSVPPPASTRVA